MSAAIPLDEPVRKRVLDALHVLDTLPEGFSDAVAAAAAAIANVPISAISLVDTDRQWFKSSCGLDIDETPRDVSFCAHAILSTGAFIVEDASIDPRFQDNPLVTGAPHIRFYAGFPLVVAGQPVGSLCVIDDRPRRLSESAIERLTQLAAGTSAWLADRDSLQGSLARTEAELRYVTFHDVVTGLPNRLLFQDRLKQAIAGCERRTTRLAVLSIEIAGSGAAGHTCGIHDRDTLLRLMATRLTGAARAADTVAYAGGEQFLVCTDGFPDLDAVTLHANRLLGVLVVACASAHCAVRTSASIGIALYPDDGSPSALVANASTAATIARNDGGGCVRFFEEAMNLEARATAAAVEQLRVALERDELRLHFQPKIHALTGHIAGAEALVRWAHPLRGLIGPNDFIPLAEQFGLIDDLGRWVVTEACRQMAAWRKDGLLLRVAINLSVQELHRTTLADDIAAALARHDVDPTLLTCEITESVAMGDAAVALDSFRQLTRIGIQLSIDDFGTGYSSLSYLRKFPVHQLKIDRSFVTDLGHSDDAQAVAGAIVDLAHALRLRVVAEGVESPEQADVLRRLGCDELQGYHFATPMEADRLFAWMAERASVAGAVESPPSSPPPSRVECIATSACAADHGRLGTILQSER